MKRMLVAVLALCLAGIFCGCSSDSQSEKKSEVIEYSLSSRPKDINLKKESIELYEGDKNKLEVVVDGAAANAEDFYYSSSDSRVAVVNDNGEVTGVSKGEATVEISSKKYPGLKTAGLIYVYEKQQEDDYDSSDVVDVPDFIGMMIDDIKNNTDYKFDFSISYTFDNNKSENIVLSQEPLADSKKIKENAVIKLVVNGKEPKIQVPRLKYFSQEKAIERIREKNLICDEQDIKSVYSESVDSGYVISSSPEEGKEVNAGTHITITVSKGPDPDKEKSLASENTYIIGDDSLSDVFADITSDPDTYSYYSITEANTRRAEAARECLRSYEADQSDIDKLSLKQSYFLINVISAAQGRIMSDSELNEFFNSLDWYRNISESDKFSKEDASRMGENINDITYNKMSSIEKKNYNKIYKHQKALKENN